MKKCIRNYLTVGFLIVAIIVVALIEKVSNSKSDRLKLNVESQYSTTLANGDNSEPADISEDIYIHISGEVKYPGIVELKSGSRLIDAVDKSGGISDDVDLDKINLAMVLEDEQKIYIPRIGEETTEETSVSTTESKVNINTADRETLMTLPGIGEKTADKIIKYRTEQSFKSIEEIQDVPGIGPAKFNELKDYIDY